MDRLRQRHQHLRFGARRIRERPARQRTARHRSAGLPDRLLRHGRHGARGRRGPHGPATETRSPPLPRRARIRRERASVGRAARQALRTPPLRPRSEPLRLGRPAPRDGIPEQLPRHARPHLVRVAAGNLRTRSRDASGRGRPRPDALREPDVRPLRDHALSGSVRNGPHRHPGQQHPHVQRPERRRRIQHRLSVPSEPHERFPVRVQRLGEQHLDRHGRPGLRGEALAAQELQLRLPPCAADAGQIHQRRLRPERRHAVDREPLQGAAGLQSRRSGAVVHRLELRFHVADRQQRHRIAAYGLGRTAVDQHQRPHRGLHDGSQPHHRTHAAGRTRHGQPVLRRLRQTDVGRDRKGHFRMEGRCSCGPALRRLRRAGHHPARRRQTAGRRIGPGHLHRQHARFQQQQPLSPADRQHDGRGAAPPVVPAAEKRRLAVDRHPLRRGRALRPPAGFPLVHAPQRNGQQRDLRHDRGCHRKRMGEHLLRTLAHFARLRTRHHLLPVRPTA